MTMAFIIRGTQEHMLPQSPGFIFKSDIYNQMNKMSWWALKFMFLSWDTLNCVSLAVFFTAQWATGLHSQLQGSHED